MSTTEIVTDTLSWQSDRVTATLERAGYAVIHGTSRQDGSTIEIVLTPDDAARPSTDPDEPVIEPIHVRLSCKPDTLPVAPPDATYTCSPTLTWSSQPTPRPLWRCSDPNSEMWWLFADSPGVELILLPHRCLGRTLALRAIRPS